MATISPVVRLGVPQGTDITEQELNAFRGQPGFQTPPPPGPGLTPDQITSEQLLNDETLRRYQELFAAQRDVGLAGVGLSRQGLIFDREIGMRQIEEARERGQEAVISDVLQRGIFDSGIRIEAQQDVDRLAQQAALDLERGISLGLQELMLRVAELQNQFFINTATAGFDIRSAEDQTIFDMITQFGAQSGGFSIGGGAGGNNLDPNNIAAAHAGVGVYGARRQNTLSLASQLSGMFPDFRFDTGFRDPSVGASAGSGRVNNSDHKTGGAMDIFINPNDPDQVARGQELMTILQRLQTQGAIAFIKWRPFARDGDHNDHIHVSMALGGISPAIGSTSSTGVSPVTTQTRITTGGGVSAT